MRTPVNTRAVAHLVNYLTTFIYKYIYIHIAMKSLVHINESS